MPHAQFCWNVQQRSHRALKMSLTALHARSCWISAAQSDSSVRLRNWQNGFGLLWQRQAFHPPRRKAGAIRGITVIPSGDEAKAIANLPIAELRLEEEHLETFVLWGILTFGALR